MKTKINQHGQITIPWVFRAGYRLQPGDEVEIEHGQVGALVLKLRPTKKPWEADDGKGWDSRRKDPFHQKPLPSPAVTDSSKIVSVK